MIFASLLLILVAIVLAILGVIQGSDPLLVGSILASLLTAVFLAVSARQAAAMRLAAGQDGFTVRLAPPRRAAETTSTAAYEPTPAEEAEEAEEAAADRATSIPSQDRIEDRGDERLATPTAETSATDGLDTDLGAEPELTTQVELDLHPAGTGIGDPALDALDPDEDPLDEPPAQLIPPGEAAMVAGLETDVMVVDGRPRYHLVTCAHLRGREIEALPVSEAVELGFTPCSLCEPDTALLAQARRG